MDGVSKLKVKIGPHEFEAEGAWEDVKALYDAFMSMVAAGAGNATPQPHYLLPPADYSAIIPPIPPNTPLTDTLLSKIMRVEDRVISLTVRPKSAEDAVLLLLYGQKVLRENDSVTGAEVIDGLTATGGLQVSRADRLLEKAGRDGDVIVIGERRAKRYRLTNAGITKARAIAADAIATVA